MPNCYSENDLVEQPAIQLFSEMGWQTASALEEVFGVGGTLGRETKGETVLVSRPRAGLERLNPFLQPEALSSAIDQLIRDRSVMRLAAANREVYGFLKEGIPVSVLDAKGERPKMRHTVHSLRYQAANLRRARDLLRSRLLSGRGELRLMDTLA